MIHFMKKKKRKKKTVLHDIESQSRFSNLPNERKILLMKNPVIHLFHIFCHVIVFLCKLSMIYIL